MCYIKLLRIYNFSQTRLFYYSQIMHIATFFDSKELSSGYSLNHIVDKLSRMQILGSQKVYS